MTTRLQYRKAIGKQLGRSYYVNSTTHPTVACTTTTIFDAARTENPKFWEGASLLVGGVERLVNGGAPVNNASVTPALYLDRALAVAPGLSVAYELLKGFLFDDMHEGIARAHTLAYPYLYDTQTTLVSETADVENLVASAAGNWRNIAEVNRKGVGETRYVPQREGYHYKWRIEGGTWRFLPQYTTQVGAELQFIADVPRTFDPGDDVTDSIASIDLIVAGALWWMYDKGANPDEATVQDRWAKEADKWSTIFELRKRQYAMPYQGRSKVIRPAVHVIQGIDRY